MPKKRKYRPLRLILLIIIIVCLVQLGRAHFESVKQQEQQESLSLSKELQESIVPEDTEEASNIAAVSDSESGESRTEEPENAEDAEENQPPVILEKYQTLYDENKDLAGWLKIEDTKIDYPVMQCEDNEYYLHHDFYGEDSKYGCLFVKDIANLEMGTNFVVYGHNMKDGSMFGELDNYREQEFYQEHPEILFDTLYEEYSYEIVAVFLSQVYQAEEDVFKYYQFYEADSEEEFQDFYTNIKELALYDTGVTAQYGDRFLTLSTCAYHTQDGRFVVVAKRKD